MAEVFRLAGLAVCAAVLIDLLRRYSPGYAVLASLACCALIVLLLADDIGALLAAVRVFSQAAASDELACAFKAVAIALVSQMLQELCAEAGQPALAGRVDLAGRVLVLAAALPLLEKLGEVLKTLL